MGSVDQLVGVLTISDTCGHLEHFAQACALISGREYETHG